MVSSFEYQDILNILNRIPTYNITNYRKGIHWVQGLAQIFKFAVITVYRWLWFIIFIHILFSVINQNNHQVFDIYIIWQCQTHIMCYLIFRKVCFHHPWSLHLYHLFIFIEWNSSLSTFATFYLNFDEEISDLYINSKLHMIYHRFSL